MPSTAMRDSADAIALLIRDHRQLERWFEEFKATNSLWQEEQLAFDICTGVRVHTEIDEEVFYPAFVAATGDVHRHDMAMKEHAAINALIDEIERAGPTEDTFFAKLHVLGELFRQHVQEEEKSRGVFDEAEHSNLDLKDLGKRLQERKGELLNEFGALEGATLT